jgi:hypothetical protein
MHVNTQKNTQNSKDFIPLYRFIICRFSKDKIVDLIMFSLTLSNAWAFKSVSLSWDKVENLYLKDAALKLTFTNLHWEGLKEKLSESKRSKDEACYVDTFLFYELISREGAALTNKDFFYRILKWSTKMSVIKIYLGKSFSSKE